MKTKPNDVLEQNVSSLLETGGEPPRIADTARARIRTDLVARFGVEMKRTRSPLFAIGIGLAATAAAALLVTRLVGGGGGDTPVVPDGTLADGSTWITAPGGEVHVIGPRHVRVEGAALLDVVPGKGTFIVETARGTIEVLGTRFMVAADKDQTTTAVVRGEVKLATTEGDVVLHAGEQGVAEPGRPPTRGPAPRLSHLVSWAALARHRAEQTEPVHHGTLFARDPGVRSHPPWGQEYPLPLQQLTVDVTIENQVARVALDQTFHNNESQVLEGVYRFAIPPDASLQRLAMYVDGKLTESAVVERMQARRIYEELVYRRVDPALLEWAGVGRLSLRVYPLPAQQDKRLVLAYTQSLPKLYDAWTLTIPLPEVDQPVGDVKFAVRIKGCANCEIASTSHAIEVERHGDDAVVSYHKTSDKIGDSLVLHVRDSHDKPTVAVEQADGDSYVLVRARAELVKRAQAYRPRTWVILDDVSASRDAMARRAQSEMIDAFLDELDEHDKVSVVAFDVTARQILAPTRVIDADRKAVHRALQGEGGVGATDFSSALGKASELLAGAPPDDAFVVYIGDGVITSGPRHLDELRTQLAGKAHFVGVGLGDGPDTQTLEALAAATGGYTTTIDLADDVGWRTFDLVAALHTARVTGIDAKLVDASGDLVPATLYLKSPQLADGEEVELVAKLAGSKPPVAAVLSGTEDGAEWHQRIALDHATPHAGYLPRMWAQRHITARLLAKHEPVTVAACDNKTRCASEAEAREARDESIRKDVVALGKKYFLLSRHTSLLVLENDAMYAQYGVQKGSGETWARYTLPATIPVPKPIATPTVTVPANVADDAELVRVPLQVFYRANDGWDQAQTRTTIDLLTKRGAAEAGEELADLAHPTGSSAALDIPRASWAANAGPAAEDGDFHARLHDVDAQSTAQGIVIEAKAKAVREVFAGDEFGVTGGATITTALPAQQLALGHGAGGGGGVGVGYGRRYTRYGGWNGGLYPQHFTYPTDSAFDDLTGIIPALVQDPSDLWRRQLGDLHVTAAHVIDPAARDLLAAARRALPAGVYRWEDLELAVDSARRIGWRRTTETDLLETASFDGTTWTRRYAELGLDVTRTLTDDDIALAFAYLPLWIAEPAHYARWFDVHATGKSVTLSRTVNSKASVVFVLGFDDANHLTSITTGDGIELLSVTWGPGGPVAASALGRAVSIGFTGEAIPDATAWAHAGSQAGVVVELPAHLPAYWTTKLATLTESSATWRAAQRQAMVAYAATNRRDLLATTFESLRAHGGVELGDLVLASGALATHVDDKTFTAATAPFATMQITRYIAAGRAYRASSQPEKLQPALTSGAVGALWQIREIGAQAAAQHGKAAVDHLIAMGQRAPALRLAVASVIGNNYSLPAEDIGRAWDSVATGSYKNVARSMAAMALYSRGKYDAAAERIATLVAELDVAAEPPELANAPYIFQVSRRGVAGWQLVWTQWKSKVLASNSYEHVMALTALGANNPADQSLILARAAVLAGNDVDRISAVARMALTYNQGMVAQTIITGALKAHPTRDLYQLAGALALQAGRAGEALADLEAAQDLAQGERASIATVRQELGAIIGVAQQLAVQSSGKDRAAAVARGMQWGARWRAIDPGNPSVDAALGELQLAVGNTTEAWRQLSTVIERDPMSGQGYEIVAASFERQGRVADALDYWEQAIVIDQTNPTPRLRKAQALIALGRAPEGDVLLGQIADRHWHDIWSNVVWQAKDLLARGKQQR